jgi:hypothetical protein
MVNDYDIDRQLTLLLRDTTNSNIQAFYMGLGQGLAFNKPNLDSKELHSYIMSLAEVINDYIVVELPVIMLTIKKTYELFALRGKKMYQKTGSFKQIFGVEQIFGEDLTTLYEENRPQIDRTVFFTNSLLEYLGRD